MNSPEEIKSYKSPLVIPAESQIVLVKYLDSWYRAQIIEINDIGDDVELKVCIIKNCRS